MEAALEAGEYVHYDYKSQASQIPPNIADLGDNCGHDVDAEGGSKTKSVAAVDLVGLDGEQ